MVTLELTQNKKQAQIQTTDHNVFSLIRENFSIPFKSFSKNKRFAPQRKYAITPSGKFDIGLLHEIKNYLLINQIEFSILPELQDCFDIGFNEPFVKQYNLTYREHQKLSIYKAMTHGRGVVVIPTAGGKTLIMCSIIESLRGNIKDKNAKALVIVPSIQLVEQTAEDFKSYGMDKVTKWSGNNTPDPDATTIIAGSQILLSEKTDLSFLADINVLLVDECIRKNTLISTNKGNVKIQNIKIGDLVKSFNKDTNKIEYKPVLNLWKNLNKSNSYEEFLEIELENGNIVHLTPNHKVYTDNGYKRADELLITDNVLFINSSKWVNFRCKFLYAKTSIETQLFNMWKRIKICFETFKILSSRNNIKTILRQIFKIIIYMI